MKNGYIRQRERELINDALAGRGTAGKDYIKSRLLSRTGKDMADYLRDEVKSINLVSRYAIKEGKELPKLDDRELERELARLHRGRFTDGAIGTFLCELINPPPDEAAGERDISPLAIIQPLRMYLHRLRFSDPNLEEERRQCIQSLDRIFSKMHAKAVLIGREDADNDFLRIATAKPLPIVVGQNVVHQAVWSSGQIIRTTIVPREMAELVAQFEAGTEETSRQKEVLLLKLSNNSTLSIIKTATDKTIVGERLRIDKEDELRGIDESPHINQLIGAPGLERLFAEMAARKGSSMYVQITHQIDKRKMLLLGLALLEECGVQGPQEVNKVINMMFLKTLSKANDLRWLLHEADVDGVNRGDKAKEPNISELMAMTFFEEVNFDNEFDTTITGSSEESERLQAAVANILGLKSASDLSLDCTSPQLSVQKNRPVAVRLLVGRGLLSMYDEMVHKGRGGSYRSHLLRTIKMLAGPELELLTASSNYKKIALTARGRELVRLRGTKWIKEWHSYEIVFAQTPALPKRKRITSLDAIK